MSDNFVIGVQTEILFGVMPAELLTLDTPTAPPDVVITTSAAANAGVATIPVNALTKPVAAGCLLKFAVPVVATLSTPATANAVSLTVTALTGAIPNGGTLYFFNDGFQVNTTADAAIGDTAIHTDPLPAALANGAIGYYFTTALHFAYTTSHAKTGDAQLFVEPLAAAIASGSVCLHSGLQLLEGGTTSDEQIQSKDTESQTYGKGLKYANGKVTGASWQISYSFNVLPTDPGYYSMKYAARNALAGVRGWVRKLDPAPDGYTVGERIEGVCDCTDFGKTSPADGIITGERKLPRIAVMQY